MYETFIQADSNLENGIMEHGCRAIYPSLVERTNE
jgi:hypothetical protein